MLEGTQSRRTVFGGRQFDHGRDDLAPLVVVDADHGTVADARMRQQFRLHLPPHEDNQFDWVRSLPKLGKVKQELILI